MSAPPTQKRPLSVSTSGNVAPPQPHLVQKVVRGVVTWVDPTIPHGCFDGAKEAAKLFKTMLLQKERWGINKYIYYLHGSMGMATKFYHTKDPTFGSGTGEGDKWWKEFFDILANAGYFISRSFQTSNMFEPGYMYGLSEKAKKWLTKHERSGKTTQLILEKTHTLSCNWHGTCKCPEGYKRYDADDYFDRPKHVILTGVRKRKWTDCSANGYEDCAEQAVVADGPKWSVKEEDTVLSAEHLAIFNTLQPAVQALYQRVVLSY